MKNKAPLILMEQVVMVLVFALTSAWCLRMFVLSEKLSVTYMATDRAVIEAQNAAEYLKQGALDEYLNLYGATEEPDCWLVSYDKDWNVTTQDRETKYVLKLFLTDSQNEFLWTAEIAVFSEDEELICISVAGQKDTEVESDA